jgi:hypothetical protein
MESQDRALMLDLLGYSRGGQVNHLPDDIIMTINSFLFFDVRSPAYHQHFEHKNIKDDKLFALDDMLYYINRSLVRHITGKYGVDYTPILLTNKVCCVCGEFVSNWHHIPDVSKCSCKVMSNEDIDELEYKRQCSGLWNEDEIFEDQKRSTKNFENQENEEYEMEDDDYSDRKLNWDEGSIDDEMEDEYYSDRKLNWDIDDYY